MFTLIKGGIVYIPEKIGEKDILIVGKTIAKISDQIDLPTDFNAQIISAEGKIVTPGFIDLHVHIAGGGGETPPNKNPRNYPLQNHLRRGDYSYRVSWSR